MTARVAVTGMGSVSGLGAGAVHTWSEVLAGRSGIRTLARAYGDEPAWRYAGPASYIDHVDTSAIEARFGLRPLAQLDPLSTFTLVATFEALSDAGLLDDPVLAERTAVLYGCGSGGNFTQDEGFARLYARRQTGVHPLTIPKSMISAPASQISMVFGVRGPAFVLASACASSAHAIGEAMHMIRSGRVEVAITGGAEACLTLGSWMGWVALKAMAPDACRPFSIDRKGMVLGEGAVTLVLENWDRAKARGATIYGELTGYGATADAAHITAPDGLGAERAIRLAHADAGLPLDQPVLVSSHGTGTPLNDKAETAALRAVYGEGLARNLIIATKPAHGHLIGGSGAMELMLGLLALRDGRAPPVLNHLGVDPECDVPLALEATQIDCETLVSSSFAFGGLNAVLTARRA